MKLNIPIFFLLITAFTLSPALYACSEDDNDIPEKEEQTDDETESTTKVNAVTNLKASQTEKANELLISWDNAANVTTVELSWWPENAEESEASTTNVSIFSGIKKERRITVSKYGTYYIGAVAIDKDGNRSEKVKVKGTPAEKDFRMNWSELADSCTYVLIEQFMDKEKGTFWSTPHDINHDSEFIYWQQAHAMDVVIYSYERIKDLDPERASAYENYFRLWYENHANNYHNDPTDETGFLNDFTDDMCWICLTLIHMTEATGNNLYMETAKKVYDNYIITRAWTDNRGTGLPWEIDDSNRNACTNAPGCLIAAKLYLKYGNENYLENAKTLYRYVMDNLEEGNGKIEEPPLTYTQGTFGEACRQLYHATGESHYMKNAEEAIIYGLTSDRCTSNGILRHEGESMDQSIFKAVLIPYAVNLSLDESAQTSVRSQIYTCIEQNAETLRHHLDRSQWPAMYCNYFWGETFPKDGTGSMGAQTSGASLMEGAARLISSPDSEE